MFVVYRYIFKNAEKVGLQEIGPRFTLKLRSLQKGTFDSLYGDYVWVHKVSATSITVRSVVIAFSLSASKWIPIEKDSSCNTVADGLVADC